MLQKNAGLYVLWHPDIRLGLTGSPVDLWRCVADADVDIPIFLNAHMRPGLNGIHRAEIAQPWHAQDLGTSVQPQTDALL